MPTGSDGNIVDPAQHPTAVPGSAFYELQFYPPGWVGAAGGGSSCDPAKWCAAVMINSWSQNPIDGQALNGTCQSEILGGIEYTNYAYLTLDGKPLGPPDPLHFNAASANPDNPDTLLLGQGDHVIVTITDTPSGTKAVVQDTTTGQAGSMTASAANGFGQIQFAPEGTGCTVLPYDYHPMFSTSTPKTRISWAAHSTNVTFTDELSHFDFCTHVSPQTGSCGGLEGIPGDREPADGDDNFCFEAAASLSYLVGGCEDSNDPGFDGPSCQNDWPDGTADHPTPVAFTSPLTGPGYRTRYSRVGFETDLPRNESPLFFAGGGCDLTTGTGCINPPNTDDGQPAAFYPYFSSINDHGRDGCHWVLGNFRSAPGVNDFGGDAQFGSLAPLTYYDPPFGASGGATSTSYPDFRNVITNPC